MQKSSSKTGTKRTLGDPQVCYDMLGNATVPQAPQVQLHSQPQFDMLGNPIGDNPPQPQPAPEPENKINGVSIVGVVNTENTEPEEKTGKFYIFFKNNDYVGLF